MAVKIYISKAYDKIRWEFLKAMLSKVGFDRKWVTMIMHCVISVKYMVNLNRKEIGPINSHKDLQRGNSLSPNHPSFV